MKLFDKIKDLFMDEVSEEDEMELEEENKEIYEEPKDILPKVMRDTIKKEEEKVEFKVRPEGLMEVDKKTTERVIQQPIIQKQEKPVMDQPVSQSTKKFSFPIDFGDEMPSRSSKASMGNVNVLKAEKEIPKKVSELYQKKEEVKEKPKFKATPVISPVYGILDKNYKKEEVKEKSEDNVEMKRPSKKVDFETVRKKAFGNLADEIKDNLMCENCELYKEVKKISSLKEDDLLYDMTVDDEMKDVTIEKAYDNYEEFGVAYEPKINNTNQEDDLTSKSDNVILDEKIDTVEENDLEKHLASSDTKEEAIPTRMQFKEKREEKNDDKVDKDFFELIDSMYKERTDD